MNVEIEYLLYLIRLGLAEAGYNKQEQNLAIKRLIDRLQENITKDEKMLVYET